jgi:hypothetical protein
MGVKVKPQLWGSRFLYAYDEASLIFGKRTSTVLLYLVLNDICGGPKVRDLVFVLYFIGPVIFGT